MDKPTPDQLRQNRKTATIFGSVSIAGLIVLVYVLVNYFREAEELTLIASFAVYLLIVALLGGVWTRRRKRNQRNSQRQIS